MEINRHSLRVAIFSGILTLAAFAQCGWAADRGFRPPFSWRHVPVYADVGSYTGFTHSQARFLATHFSMLSVEKGQGWLLQKPGQSPNGESEFLKTARLLKRYNPHVCVLFYWNALKYFPFYQADALVKPAWFSGSFNWNMKAFMASSSRPNHDAWLAGKFYNVADPAFDKWWVNAAANMLAHSRVNGIFVDGGITDPASTAQSDAQRLRLLSQLQFRLRQLGRPKLILLNGLEGCGNKSGLDAAKAARFLRLADGAMFEHFDFVYSGDPGGASPQRVLAEMLAVMAASHSGKIIVVKGWPKFNWVIPGVNKIPYATLVARARKDITFPLACFLICAGRYTYFDYSWGYRMGDGTIILSKNGRLVKNGRDVDPRWYPELQKPLGPPRGPPMRRGYIFTRRFQHADVWVDLTSHQARIRWH